MATSDSELLSEIRDFGQVKTEELSDDEISTAISRAKRHLRTEAQLSSSNPDWYSAVVTEDALFWTAVLFVKVVNGDLDAKAISVGDIDEDYLRAEDTLWYRNYTSTKERLKAERGSSSSNVRQTSRTTREGSRYYTRDDE